MTPKRIDLIVEYVSEGRAEHERSVPASLRLLVPAPWQLPVSGGCLLPILARSPSHAAIAMIHHRFRIAIIARWTDLRASNPGIERVVSPLDLGVFSHQSVLLCRRQRGSARFSELSCVLEHAKTRKPASLPWLRNLENVEVVQRILSDRECVSHFLILPHQRACSSAQSVEACNPL